MKRKNNTNKIENLEATINYLFMVITKLMLQVQANSNAIDMLWFSKDYEVIEFDENE